MDHVEFFDLPVYRLTREAYSGDWEAKVQRPRANDPPGLDPALVDRFDQQTRHIRHQSYGGWEYNEIVGYIRLHLLGSQIRGAYVSAEKQRTVLTRRKVFLPRSHKLGGELTLPSRRTATNVDLWEAVQQYVARCGRELTKGRYIDDRLLMTIGPHLDWRGLFGWRSTSRG